MNGLSPRLQQKIGAAMAAQVDRANSSRLTALQLSIEDRVALIEENIRLQQLLHQLKAENAKLKAMLSGQTEHKGGREVITPKEAAQRLGVSKSTISRRFHKGKIQGYCLPNSNRQRIYADSLSIS